MNPNNQNSEVTAGSQISYWLETVRQKKIDTSVSDSDTEVVIIGAGIAGLSTAYQLIQEGKKVIVLDDGNIGSGETGRTSAHLSASLDTRYFELQSLFGKENARLIAESHTMAIDTIEKISRLEGIDCDFKRVSGYLLPHETDKPETIIKEFNAAWESGLNVTFHEWVYFLKNITGPFLEFKNQAIFHPLKYLNGLAASIIQQGGRIFTSTRAKEIDKSGVITADGHHISADYIVVTTNTPINNKYVMHLNQFPYRTYIIGALVRKGAVENALFWDTGVQEKGNSFQPYHYVRLCEYNNMYDLLLCGGEDHGTGLTEATIPPDEKSRYRKLSEWAEERFPIESIAYEWSGQVLYSYDSLAYIGKNPFDADNIYISTGDCGNGLTYGVIAGSIITDLIQKKENKFAELYKPSRCKMWQAGSVFIEEFFNGLRDYYKVKNSDVTENPEDIIHADGKVFELDGIKYGVSKIDSEWIDIVTTECTHLGCTLKWNNAEKSWDCPCHGSRFTQTGEVINGPANVNLKHYKIRLSDFKNYASQNKAIP